MDVFVFGVFQTNIFSCRILCCGVGFLSWTVGLATMSVLQQNFLLTKKSQHKYRQYACVRLELTSQLAHQDWLLITSITMNYHHVTPLLGVMWKKHVIFSHKKNSKHCCNLWAKLLTVNSQKHPKGWPFTNLRAGETSSNLLNSKFCCLGIYKDPKMVVTNNHGFSY